jgi:hypothetical protein
MAEEATQTGDDQQNTGEDQSSNANDERIAQLEAELKETNGYITRLQQQQAQAPVSQEADDTEEIDLSGVSPEQRRLLQKVTGADELKKELAEIRKEREAERAQAAADRLKNDVSAVAKEFSPDQGYPKVDQDKLAEHMQKTGIFNPRAAYKDLHEAAIYDVQRKAAEPKASTSDRSDAVKKTGLSKEEYHEKLLKLTLDGKVDERRKLMLEHGSVAPDKI